MGATNVLPPIVNTDVNPIGQPIMGTTNVLPPIVNTNVNPTGQPIMGATNVLQPIVNTSVNQPIVAGSTLPTALDQITSSS